MPLKLLASLLQPLASQDSSKIPDALTILVVDASASFFAASTYWASEVASYISTRPPSTTPWLYVHACCPLPLQASVSPSWTSPAALTRPLPSNQRQALSAHAKYSVSSGDLR